MEKVCFLSYSLSVMRALSNYRQLSVLPILLLFCNVSLAQSDGTDQAQQAFERQHWEEVETQLADHQANSREQRMLALARFQLQNFDLALPGVKSVLGEFPDDLDLNRALLVMLVGLDQNEQARQHLAQLESLGDTDFANFYRARMLAQEGDVGTAETLLRSLLDAPDADLAQQAADALIELLQNAGRHREIHPVAEQALARDPDSFSAYRFEQYTRLDQSASRSYDVSVGYRLEYDDNVALLPGQQGLIFGNPDEEDFRHVLFADLLYRRALVGGLNLFAEGHFSHSIHQDLSEFDFTRLNFLAGLGGSHSTWGWRVPVEFSHDRFDGNSFRDTWSVTPGAYLRVSTGLHTHLYLRFRSEDYERSVSVSEDRSGETTGVGLLLVGTMGDRWRLRVFAESDDIDADGRNWKREEWRVHAFAEFSPAPDWSIGAGFRYQEADFDEIHDVFLLQRKDETSQVFASLSHRFREHWQFRVQLAVVEQQSSLQTYEYERTVLNVGFSRDF